MFGTNFRDEFCYARGNRCIFMGISVRCTGIYNYGCICDAHMVKIFRMTAKNDTVVTGTTKKTFTQQSYTEISDIVLPFPYEFLNANDAFDPTVSPILNLSLLQSTTQQYVNQLQLNVNEKRKVLHILQAIIAGGAINIDSDICSNIAAFNDFFTKARESMFQNIYKDAQITIFTTVRGNPNAQSFDYPMSKLAKFYQLILLYAVRSFNYSDKERYPGIYFRPNLLLNNDLHQFKIINNIKENEIMLCKDGATVSTPIVLCGKERFDNVVEPFNKGIVSITTPLLERLPTFCLDRRQ